MGTSDTISQPRRYIINLLLSERQKLKWEFAILSALGYYRTFETLYDMLKYNIRGMNIREKLNLGFWFSFPLLFQKWF